MQVELRPRFDAVTDTWFWLRGPPDGSSADGLRREVAGVFGGLAPGAFLLLDSAVAGEPGGASALRAAVPDLPETFRGIPVRRTIARLADVLGAAPPPPEERRAVVEQAIGNTDVAAIEHAIVWVAGCLGFTFAEDGPPVVVDVRVVASGVPLGGLTGFRLDDSPVCFVNVAGQEGSTFAEAIIHEAIHVLDISCPAGDSLVARLRARPPVSSQLWHVPFFVAAAEATRRFVDSGHRDFGDTHGYYAKVPGELAALEGEGVVERIRSCP